MTTTDSEGYYKVYEEHMKTLRAWFVAYGVGGPVLFVTQQHFAETLVGSGAITFIAYLFLLGVVLQVIIAALNKWVSWYLYYCSEHSSANTGKIYKIVKNISEMFWIDIVFDIGTLVLFAWATIKVMLVFATSLVVN